MGARAGLDGFGKEKKYPVSIPTPERPASSLVTLPTVPCRLLFNMKPKKKTVVTSVKTSDLYKEYIQFRTRPDTE